MSTGKKVAQGAHAAVTATEAARKLTPNIYSAWLNEGQKKVALKVQSEDELVSYYQKGKDMRLPCSLIQDAGLTEIPAGSRTAVAIGPGLAVDIDKITGELKLL